MIPITLFGKGYHNSDGIHSEPVPPRPGPARLAVLVHNGRRVLIAKVLECVTHARQNGMIGATVTCLGPRLAGERVRPCAVIEAFDWAALVAANRLTAGGPPGIGLDEVQLLIA